MRVWRACLRFSEEDRVLKLIENLKENGIRIFRFLSYGENVAEFSWLSKLVEMSGIRPLFIAEVNGDEN